MSLNQVAVGVQNNPDSSSPIVARGGKQGDQMVSELHGRFYEQTYRGNVFGGGGTVLTSINNATFTTATTGATATPILGLWNPASNSVNCVLLQASLQTVLTALLATGPGGYVWMAALANKGLTLGAVPINRKTLQASGSNAIVFGNGVALTGLTGALATVFASALGGGATYNVSETGTAAGFMPEATSPVENFDGSFIVPPGGIIALMATTTPVAHSVVGNLLWEEVPI